MIIYNKKLILKKILETSKITNLRYLRKIFSYIEKKPILSSCSPFIIEKLFVDYRKKKFYFIYIIFAIIKTLKVILIFLFKSIINKPQKKITFEKILFFFSNKYEDQHNIFPISEKLIKKNINHTLLFSNFPQKKNYHKIQKKFSNKILVIEDLIVLTDILSGLRMFLSSKNEIINLSKILKFDFYQKIILIKFYLIFFIYLNLYSRIFKKVSIDYLFSHRFNSDSLCSLIYYFKHKCKKKIQVCSYEFLGLGGESALYLYSNSDILFVPSKLDFKLVNKIKKNNLFFTNFLKLKLTGSIRHEHFLENLKWKKEKNSNKLKILFILSRSNHYNSVDVRAFKLFIKVFQKFKDQIDLKIKDRPDIESPLIKLFLKEKLIKQNNIIRNNKDLIEDNIIDADLCIGTCSSGLTKQAVWLNKPIIQIFRDELVQYQLNFSINVKNEGELEKIFKKFLKKNFANNRKKMAQLLNSSIQPQKKPSKIFLDFF